MSSSNARELLEQATVSYALGDSQVALDQIAQALDVDPNLTDAWHARAEIHLDRKELDPALEAAEKALTLDENDIFAHTTLSRIWMEKGDKPKAEHHGAQARLLGWKNDLQEPPTED